MDFSMIFGEWIARMVEWQEELNGLRIVKTGDGHAILAMTLPSGDEMQVYVSFSDRGVVSFYAPAQVPAVDLNLLSELMLRNSTAARGSWCFMQTQPNAFQLGLLFRTPVYLCELEEFGFILTGMYIEFSSFLDEMQKRVSQLEAQYAARLEEQEAQYWGVTHRDVPKL